MTRISIIVPVAEEHDGTPYGQYVRHIEMPRVPTPGEWIAVADKATTVQNVLWYIEAGEYARVEVFLSQRPVGPGYPETINELFDAGFMPMRPDGSEVTWEEDAALRQAASQPQASESAEVPAET